MESYEKARVSQKLLVTPLEIMTTLLLCRVFIGCLDILEIVDKVEAGLKSAVLSQNSFVSDGS